MSEVRGVRTLPELPGILSAEQVADTADHLASLQRVDGMIPWFEGGHCDPWNHVEAAMALSVCGRLAEAEAAYGGSPPPSLPTARGSTTTWATA